MSPNKKWQPFTTTTLAPAHWIGKPMHDLRLKTIRANLGRR